MMSQEHAGLLKYATFSFSDILILFNVFSRADATFISFLFRSNECGKVYLSRIKIFLH